MEQSTTRYGHPRVARWTLARRCGCGLLVLCGVAGDGHAEGSVESDRAALMAVYDATNGPRWRENTNWGSDAPLGEWTGVLTDVEGRVTSLFLDGNDLVGMLPGDLGNLRRLESLSLNANTLTGSVPAGFGNLVNLRELFLNENFLTGPFPPSLGDLVNLEKLHLGFNLFSGPIPALNGLGNLRELNLSANKFSGRIPAALGGLTNLTSLWLLNNDLTGPIPPELGNLMNLGFLIVGNDDGVPFGGRNALTGEVPSELGNLRNLGVFWIQANRLEGELPASLTNLPLDYAGVGPTLSFEGNAGLCAPADQAFQAWLDSLPFGYTGPVCGAAVPAVPALGLLLLGLVLAGAGLYARRWAA